MNPQPQPSASIPVERLSELIRLAPTAMVMVDARDDEGLRVLSTGMAEMLGHSLQDLSATRLREMRHPDDPGSAP